MWPGNALSQIHMDNMLHSVKVYVMKEDEQWEFICSGQISTKYIEQLQGICLLVRSESNDSLLLETIIHPDMPYKKQQSNLIILTEANNHIMAIHFSDPDGCQDIWEDICQNQGQDRNVQITQEPKNYLNGFQDLPQIQNLCEVPTCEFSILEDIADILNFAAESPSYRERLALLLENKDYIKKLLQFFHTFEDQKNMEGLYFLYIIIKGILFLNNARLFKIMFSDEYIMDVIGCLEYNPAFDQPYKHREFLTENAKFKEIMPITRHKLRQRIHQTYRMQYIFDILSPIPSKLQENHLSNITTFIFSNKIKIVTMLQKNEMFLLEVFAQLNDVTVADERRCELLCFVKEFCAFAKILRPQKKYTLLKTLIKLGIMNAVKVSLHIKHHQIKLDTLEIFTYLVEYNPQIIRVYAIEEAQNFENDDDLLINIMIKQIICDPDPESSYVLSLTAILRTLLDPENMYGTNNGWERSEFMNFFYIYCMNNLAAPILSITVQNNSYDNRNNICTDDYENAQLLGVVLELLCFCVNHHKTYIRNYILSNNLLSRVLVLMSSKHTFLVLCALRFMRQIIGLKDDIYNLYITRKNLFEPVVNAFVHNGKKYNMLNSAIIELFEFINEENIKSLLANIGENFPMIFESIEYVQTFKKMKIKFEEEKERKRQLKCNLYNLIYQKVYIRHMKAMEVKDSDELCSRENSETIPQMEQDFMNHNNMFIQNKETSDNEVEWLEKKSSEAFENYSYHADTDNSRMSGAHCCSNISLVDYSDDDDSNNDDNLVNDEVEEATPPKRPKLGS